MLQIQNGQDKLEIWCIVPPLRACGMRPEIAARLILERRGDPRAFDLTSEQAQQVIRELQAALRLQSEPAA